MGSQKHQFWGPKKCQPTLQNPARPGGMKRWWNFRRWFWEGAARGGGFSVSLVYYVFFFLEGSDICRVFFEVSH